MTPYILKKVCICICTWSLSTRVTFGISFHVGNDKVIIACHNNFMFQLMHRERQLALNERKIIDLYII
jgi:hypothetical protein